MDWHNHIHRDPNILGGKPVFKGTRLSVQFIFEHLAGDWTEAELLENFPTLRPEHIRAAHAYAAEMVEVTRELVGGPRP